jgi:hypothetical protein
LAPLLPLQRLGHNVELGVGVCKHEHDIDGVDRVFHLVVKHERVAGTKRGLVNHDERSRLLHLTLRQLWCSSRQACKPPPCIPPPPPHITTSTHHHHHQTYTPPRSLPQCNTTSAIITTTTQHLHRTSTTTHRAIDLYWCSALCASMPTPCVPPTRCRPDPVRGVCMRVMCMWSVCVSVCVGWGGGRGSCTSVHVVDMAVV